MARICFKKKKKINYPHANQVKSQENMALCKRNT